jgi:hypothetical protein
MLKFIGIVVLAYIGWATGFIQAALLFTASILVLLAGV